MAGRSDRYPAELLESTEALTKLVAADRGFNDIMQRLAELAVHAVQGAEECSISLAVQRGKEIKTVAATAEIGNKIDDLQRATGEGPCFSSIADHETFHIRDMEQDETWPEFSKKASEETGTKSMLSYVLRLSEDATGALNMISSQLDAFSSEDIDTGTIFAAQAAVAMSDALGHKEDEEEIAHLQEAMKTRQTIGQAVGILMATRQVDAEGAFEILKRVSQSSNLKLRDIAERVVERPQDV